MRANARLRLAAVVLLGSTACTAAPSPTPTPSVAPTLDRLTGHDAAGQRERATRLADRDARAAAEPGPA